MTLKKWFIYADLAQQQPLEAALHSWPPATKPWERIHTDFASPHLGWYFLIVVDAYSKYLNAISVSNTTSRQTVAILRKLCAQHGFPETIVNDNRTQFTSHKFKEFCKANAFILILSLPYHPQSNGRAERFVDTFKCGLLKLRGREMWIKSWILSCWLTGRHPAPLFNNNVVLLNCSSDVSPDNTGSSTSDQATNGA